jgi:hypothetical protein
MKSLNFSFSSQGDGCQGKKKGIDIKKSLYVG